MNMAKTSVKILAIGVLILIAIGFLVIETDCYKEPRVGVVDAMFRSEEGRFAVVNGKEVFVKEFPNIGSELKYTRYRTRILGISWNSAY